MPNQKNILNERISPIVYHYCGYASCYGICENNQFVLSHIMRGTADGNINKTRHYLSLTRVKTHKVGFSQHRDVRITLDGEKLNSRYKGGPVDYWGASMGKQWYMKDGAERGHFDTHQSRTENEDRVFSKDPVIPNAKEYILRIDVLLTPERNGSYNEYQVQMVQNILKTGFANLVYVYGDENSFDAQNDNIINEQVAAMTANSDYTDKVYSGTIKGALLDLLNIMFSYEYDRNQMWTPCYRKLREYGISRYIIQQYGPEMLKNIELELPRKTWNIDDMTANVQNMVDTLRNYDKTLYIRSFRMLNDYLDERGIFDLYDLKAYKQGLFDKNYRGGSGLDWNKEVNVLALVDLNYDPEYNYLSGAILIPNPDTTSIWKVIPQERRYFVEDVVKYYPNHNSRSDEYFKKYLQHIARQETSVTAFMDFLSKLQVSDEAKQEILMYKKFNNVIVKASNYDHAKFLTQEDKTQIERALSYDNQQGN